MFSDQSSIFESHQKLHKLIKRSLDDENEHAKVCILLEKIIEMPNFH
jgi:hypothetical protein